ncbi:MAG: type II toxin-antitoxin system RelE/ParE family toxin [Flavobacteriaceae bacterium]|nr:type II toxin-antitoxin system RelE/ParE family toxin [Flavobacteriaceae bacterium]
MTVFWTPLADITFEEEIDFILRKWNTKEAEKFIDLVDEFKKVLSSNPYMGKISEKGQVRMFVLSKQTTVFYEVFEDKKRIDLQLFWNNSKGPKELEKYL